MNAAPKLPGCSTFNRDQNGAINIGHNFERLMRDESPIKAMTEEEVAFHRARMCLDCSD